MRRLLLLVSWLLLLAPSGNAQAFDLNLQAHAGAGAFAGRGWGANRAAEAFATSLSLRFHPLLSLDLRIVAQRLRYRSIAQVETDGWSLITLAGVQLYPLMHRYRIEPRAGVFAGQIGTHARSKMDGPSVDLEARFLAVGPSLGAHVTFGRAYAAGFDAQVLRTIEQSACMRGSARTISCDALGHTRSYLATVLLTFSVSLR